MKEQTTEEMAEEVRREFHSLPEGEKCWWLLSTTSPRKYVLVALGKGVTDPFGEAPQAIAYVKQQADAGSELHRKALVVHIAGLLGKET